MRGLVSALGATALLVHAGEAHAHLMNSGLGPFYDGLAHPFLSPDDLLPVMALVLMGGLGGASCGRRVLFTLPLAWVAGMSAGALVDGPLAPGWLVCAVTIGLGASVAADTGWPVNVVTALAGLAAVVHGFDNGRELASARGAMLAMVGIGCTLFAIAALIGGQVTTLRAQWARVAVRVGGSWIAAIAMLMFGWTIR